jgi:HSF-type DNA-binding
MCKPTIPEHNTRASSGAVTPIESRSMSQRRVSVGGVPKVHSGESSTDESSVSSAAPPAPTTSKRRKARATSITKHHPHIVTQHNYHDHAADPLLATTDATSNCETSPHSNHAHSRHTNNNKGGTAMAFPVKLYEMLQTVQDESLAHIVSWQTHGRCFVVHDPVTFKQLLPNFFKLSKIASFQRQLNLYGFQRLTVGIDKGGYYHELFLRGRADLVARIQRVKVKGTGVRAKSNPKDEPNLYLYQAVDHVAAAAIPAPEKERSMPQVLPSAEIVPRDLFPVPMDTEDLDAVQAQYMEWKNIHYNSTGVLPKLSSLDSPPKSMSFSKNVLRNLSSTIDEPTPDNKMLLEEAWDNAAEGNVNFDRLIDEMFSHDQSLDFSELLKLAAV